MEHTDIFSWLCNYFEEEFEITEVHKDDAFLNELGLSSLEVFNLISDLEYDYDIKISEKLIREMITVQDMVDMVGKVLEK